MLPSAQGGSSRDRSAPFTKPLLQHLHSYYHGYAAADLIPQAWGEVLDRLRAAGVPLQRLTRAEEDAVTVRTALQALPYRRGDYVARLNHAGARFLVENTGAPGHRIKVYVGREQRLALMPLSRGLAHALRRL